jgi:hypothetical protein
MAEHGFTLTDMLDAIGRRGGVPLLRDATTAHRSLLLPHALTFSVIT